MILLIQTLVKVVAKKKFGLCLIAKLRGQLLHFSFIQKSHHVGFFFGARWSNICLFTRLHNPAIPAQSLFFTAQFASQNPHNFNFFPAPCQKACILKLAVITHSVKDVQVALPWFSSSTYPEKTICIPVSILFLSAFTVML